MIGGFVTQGIGGGATATQFLLLGLTPAEVVVPTQVVYRLDGLDRPTMRLRGADAPTIHAYGLDRPTIRRRGVGA